MLARNLRGIDVARPNSREGLLRTATRLGSTARLIKTSKSMISALRLWCSGRKG